MRFHIKSSSYHHYAYYVHYAYTIPTMPTYNYRLFLHHWNY